MFYLILIIAALILWAYIDVNSFKASLRYGGSGVKGVASDINALKAQAKQKQVEDPNRQETIYKSLNENIIDLEDYKVQARARSIKEHTKLNEMMAKAQEELAK